jgi:hypothetical protein
LQSMPIKSTKIAVEKIIVSVNADKVDENLSAKKLFQSMPIKSTKFGEKCMQCQ